MDIIVVWCHNIRHEVAIYPNPMAEPWAHRAQRYAKGKEKGYFFFALPC